MPQSANATARNRPATPRRQALPASAMPLVQPTAEEKRRRTDFLQAYQIAQARPLDTKKARDAIKLRRFAEARYRKNVYSRITRKLPFMRPSKAKLAYLKSLDVDLLIQCVKTRTLRCDRSLLTEVATHHLMGALNIDQAAYRRGVRRMAAWEGVHSAVGRGITFAASSIAFGIAPPIKAIGNAAAIAFAAAIKLIGHQLPTALINPVVTGNLRTDTDVRKNCGNGGASRLAKEVENAATLGQIRADLKRQARALEALLHQRDEPGKARLYPDGRIVLQPHYRQALCDAFRATYAAQNAYKKRIGSAKAQTWSKGYGMGVNALAAAAQVTAVAFAPAIPFCLGVQGLCIPLQLAAGYFDLQTAQAYNFRANIKYADLLTPAGRRLPAEHLQASHIDIDRLRALFQSGQAQEVELIREIYTDELGELRLAHERLQQQLADGPPRRLLTSGGVDRAHAQRRVALSRLANLIDERQQQVRLFEAFDPVAWVKLPLDSTIGRCLDDPGFLRRQAQAARKRKPGEVAAQVWQRYKQTYGDGILSAGVLIPGVDIGLHLDALSGHEQPAASPIAAYGGDWAAGTGAASFAAATGVVRNDKPNDKRDLAKPLAAQGEARRRREALKDAWAVPLDDGRSIDLSHTGGFDRLLHSRTQRVRRFMRIIPRGFMLSERAVINTLLTRRARSQAKGMLQRALTVLHEEESWLAPQSGNAMSMAALHESFLSLPRVQRQLASETDAADRVGPSRRAR